MRLDLALVLVDATSGRNIDLYAVEFIKDDDKVLKPLSKGEGIYIFIDQGRENFSMQIKIPGYIPYNLNVNYEELDPILPKKTVFLIPLENKLNKDGYLTLSGSLKGLREISLVVKGAKEAVSDAYDPKKRTLSVFEKGFRLNTEGAVYGLINLQNNTFDSFEVIEQLSTNKIVMKKPLANEFLRNVPIGRVISGYVYPNGDYLLRIRNDGTNLMTIVKYVVNDEVKFIEVDFHNLENVNLK